MKGGKGRQGGKLFAILLASLFLLMGAAILLLSGLPFAVVHEKVIHLSQGKATFYTESFHYSIFSKLRLLGGFLIMLGAVAAFEHKAIASAARKSAEDFRDFRADAKQLVRNAWRELTLLEKSLLIGSLVLGAGLRILFLNGPLRYDEAASWRLFSSMPFYVTISFYPYPNNHVFFNLLSHIVQAVLGDGRWAIRMTSFFFGLAVIPAAWLTLRSLYGRSAGLTAALYAASAQMIVLYSVNARGYTQITVFVLLLILVASYLLQKRSSAAWMVFVLLASLGAWTIPTMLYPFLMVAVWLGGNFFLGLTGRERQTAIRDLVIASVATGVLTLLLYSPVLIVSGLDALTSNEWVTGQGFGGYLASLPGAVGATVLDWMRDIPSPLLILIAIGWIAAIVFRSPKRNRVPFLLAALVAVILLQLWQQVFPFQRTWLYLQPILAGVTGAGWYGIVERLFKSRTAIHYGLVAVLAGILFLAQGISILATRSPLRVPDTGRYLDGPEIADYLANRLNGDEIVFTGSVSSFPLSYELDRRGISLSHLETKAARTTSPLFLVYVERDGLAGLLRENRMYGYPPDSTDLVHEFNETKLYRGRISWPMPTSVPPDSSTLFQPTDTAAGSRAKILESVLEDENSTGTDTTRTP